MASLHQSHHLPWRSITDNLTYKPVSPRLPYDRTRLPFLHLIAGPTKHIHDNALRIQHLAAVQKDFAHFARALRKQIEEFSGTEKPKIAKLVSERAATHEPDSFSLQWDVRPDIRVHSSLFGEIHSNTNHPFSEDLVEDLSNSAKMCKFSWWAGNFEDGMCKYSDLTMADIVKHLVNVDTPEALVALHRLAHRDGIDIVKLNNLSYGHHYGWSRIAEHALRMYILLNVLIDKDLHCNGIKWLRAQPGFSSFEKELTDYYDGCEQNVPDRIFFKRWRADVQGLGVLKGHIKLQFRRLYLYDWLVKEAGGEVDWFNNIMFELSMWCDRDGRRYISSMPVCWKEASPTRRIAPCPISCQVHGRWT